jgi:RNA polymerase sigma-70 factor (ECF subfamily)
METLEFGRLYERYARDVMRFALYLTGSRAEAEDITSETFVRA